MKKCISLLLLGSLVFGGAMSSCAGRQQETTEAPIHAESDPSDPQKAKLEAKMVEISSQNIAYYESSGKGQTIFLVAQRARSHLFIHHSLR